MEDSQIIELYFKRAESAISYTSEKYAPLCGGIAYRILRNHEDSEECVNDTWLKAWEHIPPVRPGSLAAFLAKITRNLSIDRLRRRTHGKKKNGTVELCLEELTEVQYTVYDREDLQAALGPEAATIDALAGRTEKITARAGDAVLQVLGGSGIEIIFTESESILPDSGQLNYYDAEAYAEEHRYLAEKYLGILGFDDCMLSVSGSYGQGEAGAMFEAFVYDGADNAFDAILNYNFKTAVFYVKGNSVRITLGDTPDMLECMGFYPVITAQEARSILFADYEKKDKSDVFPEQLSEENIAYVELVYRETNGTLYGETAGAGYYLPYYQFVIRLDDAQEGALHRYGILYVPAVAPEYIEDVDAAVKFN